ncbi:MAG: hypothetical protein LUF92_03705 [Clostridiales bacterium]|nr:hypothetical protein [Clostridiales bacterium]
MQELKIDKELQEILPPLTKEEYDQLEKNIVENGYDKNFPIMVWNGFIADGHNRYEICKKHGIDFVVGTLAYKTKAEVIEWMIDIQIGRRNLTAFQRIGAMERLRPLYEKRARENLREGGRKGGEISSKSKDVDSKNKPCINLDKAYNSSNNKPDNNTGRLTSIDVTEELSKKAGISRATYSKGSQIARSNNEELKKELRSGKKSINKGYTEMKENGVRKCKVCGKTKKVEEFFGNDLHQLYVTA